MKVSVISAWAPVEPFAPYFARHYEWADRILALVGPGPWTGPKFPNVELRGVDYTTDRFSEYRKRDVLNETLRGLDSDWVLVVDADEYIFALDSRSKPTENLRPFLTGIEACANVVETRLLNVFRNIKDVDLNPDRPPLFQRRHGTRDVDPLYVKPLCVKPTAGIRLKSGQHQLFSDPRIRKSAKTLSGVHWKYSDVSIAIERKRIRDGLLHHLERWNEPDPAAVIARHGDDPKLF
jgi:hypothetical protein